MLDSNEIERALRSRGFTLEIDNTHARGFRSLDNNHLLFVKTSKKLKSDELSPLYKQPLVLHWSVKNSSGYSTLANAVPTINPNYVNHNMRGYEGPRKGDKANGIAIDVATVAMLDNVLSIIGCDSYGSKPPNEDLLAAKAELDALPETTRKAVVDARLGQGRFRDELIGLWSGCAVTGCSILNLLRASHIKPWRNSNNKERLDKFNGLLLTANLDLAFDQGLISFDETGRILIKRDVFNIDDLASLNISSSMVLRQLTVHHHPYLAEHRRIHHFKK